MLIWAVVSTYLQIALEVTEMMWRELITLNALSSSNQQSHSHIIN